MYKRVYLIQYYILSTDFVRTLYNTQSQSKFHCINVLIIIIDRRAWYTKYQMHFLLIINKFHKPCNLGSQTCSVIGYIARRVHLGKVAFR